MVQIYVYIKSLPKITSKPLNPCILSSLSTERFRFPFGGSTKENPKNTNQFIKEQALKAYKLQLMML